MVRGKRALAAGVGIAAALTALTGQAVAAGTYASARIAFESMRDGNYNIYASYADGSAGPLDAISRNKAGNSKTVNSTTTDVMPYWSPDGSKMAFTSSRDGNYEIYVKNFLTGTVSRLTNNAAPDYPSGWSPSGDKIVFYRQGSDGICHIWQMSSDGTGQTQVTGGTGDERSARYSPDGSRLVFKSSRDGDDEIYTMDATGGLGSPWAQITNNSVADFGPRWSSNGSIYFMRQDSVAVATSGLPTKIYSVSAAGDTASAPSKVVDGSTLYPSAASPTATNFSISPDGSQIAVTGCSSASDLSTCDIWKITSTGTSPQQLTTTAGQDSDPSWNPRLP